MKLAPATLPLSPIRGPLGLREIYFTRSSSPILPYSKSKRDDTIAINFAQIIAVLIVVGLVVEYVIRRMQPEQIYDTGSPDPLSYFGVIMLMGWIATQAMCVGYGILSMFTRSIRVWKRPGRLAELSLTGLRPIEIAQFIIARSQFLIRVLVAIVYVGFVVSILVFARDAMLLALPFAFVALDLVLTCRMWGWTQAALFLGTKSWFEHLITTIDFAVIYAFCLMPAFIPCFVFFRFSEPKPHIHDIAVVLPVFIWTWMIQYLFARGWALRIERAIFNRIEY